MLLHKGATGIQRNGGGVRVVAAVFLFLWVLLILAEVGFFYAVHEETSKLIVIKTSYNSTVPRKMRFLATEYSNLFHDAPSNSSSSSSSLLSSSSFMVNDKNKTEGDSADKIYEDDKRIIHTGPNPLHN